MRWPARALHLRPNLSLPKVLLFDLGGVIVPWVGMMELSRITGLSESDIAAKGFSSKIAKAYEVGDCSTNVFLDELHQSFDLGIDRADLQTVWNEWVQAPYEGTREALLRLKADYTIACLSNTNESHWDYLKDTHNILDVFDRPYASHLLKAAKPHSIAWEMCLKDRKAQPHVVWFFDDTQVNIDAAQAMGIQSYHVDRNVGVIPTLKGLGLLE